MTPDHTAIYRSEVLGQALFGFAAALSVGERRHCWRTLQALETQTLQRYLVFLDASGETARYPIGAKLGGCLYGLLFALMPWTLAMKALAAGTPQFIAQFTTLAEAASEEHRAFYRYVLAHEEAIDRFARNASGDDRRAALAVVEALLD